MHPHVYARSPITRGRLSTEHFPISGVSHLLRRSRFHSLRSQIFATIPRIANAVFHSERHRFRAVPLARREYQGGLSGKLFRLRRQFEVCPRQRRAARVWFARSWSALACRPNRPPLSRGYRERSACALEI